MILFENQNFSKNELNVSANLDGNTSYLPDLLTSKYNFDYANTDPLAGTYFKITGDTIFFNDQLTNEVRQLLSRFFQAKIMNQRASSTYIYTATGVVIVPSDRQVEYSGVVSGEGFNAGDQVFRTETVFMKVLILSNYRQDLQGAKLRFDRVEFNESP